MTSGKDESIGLAPEEITRAENEFREAKRIKYIETGMSEMEALYRSKKTTVPGVVYRKLRSETEGLLLIYLIDQRPIFEQPELREVADKNGFKLEIPLVGYALSFPEILDDPGAIYLANEVGLNDEVSEPDYEGDEMPDDIGNEINEIN